MIPSAEVIAKFKHHEGDTGSTEVQIIALTDRIKELIEHMKVNHKDYSTKRGLINLVSQRHRLLKYLRKTNSAQYAELISAVGLRK